MSRQRRNFSAKFKSDLVIELLKGEKDLNTLAVENNIQPNLLRNWKKEFLDNASAVFDDKREDSWSVDTTLRLQVESLLHYKRMPRTDFHGCSAALPGLGGWPPEHPADGS